MMEVKLSEELSAGEIGDIIAAKFPGYNLDVDWRTSAKVTKSVFPSITVPGTLLRNKLDDVEVLVVPTEQEISAAVKANQLPPLRQNHHQLRVLGDDAWLTLCEADTIVIGWMDPTK